MAKKKRVSDALVAKLIAEDIKYPDSGPQSETPDDVARMAYEIRDRRKAERSAKATLGSKANRTIIHVDQSQIEIAVQKMVSEIGCTCVGMRLEVDSAGSISAVVEVEERSYEGSDI